MSSGSSERWQEIRGQIADQQEELGAVEEYLAELEQALQEATKRLASSERVLRCSTPVGPEAETSMGGYVSTYASHHHGEDFCDRICMLNYSL